MMDSIERNVYDTLIKDNFVVYDIGAFDGELSRYFSTFKNTTVYAFEPSSFNYNRLVSNTETYKNITPFNVALNDKSYECFTKFRDCFDGNSNNEQPIKYVKLSEFLIENNLKSPNFIKIDIEGMESIILNDFHNIIKDFRPIFFIEIHAENKNSEFSYENNPHWRWVDEGGFDFNHFKNYNYACLDVHFNLISEDTNYNPNPGDYKYIILIPKDQYVK